MTASEIAVDVSDLRMSYGAHTVLDGVSFTVPAGQVYALLGPNGAGKTTLIRILTTLRRPTSGTAHVAGHDVVRSAGQVRRLISVTGQYASVDEELTGRENLVMIARLLGRRRRAAAERADELLTSFGLADAADRRAGQYSGGMRRRLDLAASLIDSPPVVFLDEPTTGMDPRSRQDLWRIVASGTAAELKRQVGEEWIELTFVDGSHERVVSDGSAERLREVLNQFHALGRPVASVTVRTPSLDDVFLTLTDQEVAA